MNDEKRVVTIDGWDYVLDRCVADRADGHSVYRAVNGDYILHNAGSHYGDGAPEWELMNEDDFAALERAVSEALKDRPRDLQAFLRNCKLNDEYDPDRDYDIHFDSLEELRDWCAENPGALVMWGWDGEWCPADELAEDVDSSWWEIAEGTEEAESGKTTRDVYITVRG